MKLTDGIVAVGKVLLVVVVVVVDAWLPPAATAYAERDCTLLLTGVLPVVVLTCDKFPATGWVGVRLKELDLLDEPGVLELLFEDLVLVDEEEGVLEFKGNDLGPGLLGDGGTV